MRFTVPFLVLTGIGLLGILACIPILSLKMADMRWFLGSPDVSDTVILAAVLLEATIILSAMVAIGVVFAEQIGLVSLIACRLKGRQSSLETKHWLSTIALAGLVSALLIMLYGMVLWLFPEVIVEIDAYEERIRPIQTSSMIALVSILYDSITGELILRFGLVTLILWLGSRLTRKIRPVYLIWAAVLIPGSYMLLISVIMGAPVSPVILTYEIIGLALGAFYAWVYIFRTLEHAMLAHVIVHGLYFSIGSTLVDFIY